MTEAKVAKLPFELKDVTSYWTAVVGLVALGLAATAAWFGFAHDPIERSVAGVGFFLVILAGLAAVFFRPADRTAAPTGGLNPANVRVGASPEQIKAPQRDELPAPDGSYLITRPPPDWEIIERDFEELLRDENRATFGTDQSPFHAQALIARAGRAQVFRAPNKVTLGVIGGRTRMHGRAGFSWSGAELRSELYVIPFDREQPPHFVDFPFPHMALQRLIGALVTGFVLQRVEFGTLDRDGAPVMVAESTQTLEDLLLDGRPVATLKRTNRMVATRGDVRDYVIAFVDYAYEATDRSYHGEIETMQAILASFRPLKVANVAAKRAERRQQADQAFEAFMSAHGREFFGMQLQFALQRIAANGLTTLPAVARAVEILRPFRDGAARFPPNPGTEPNAAALWQATAAAEVGEPSQLRAWIARAFPVPGAGPAAPPAVPIAPASRAEGEAETG